MRYGDKIGERAVRANVKPLRAATLPIVAQVALHPTAARVVRRAEPLPAAARVVRRAEPLPAAVQAAHRTVVLQVLHREGQE